MEKFSYLKSINAGYIDELYARFVADPDSVDASWRLLFEGLELGATAEGEAPAPASAPAESPVSLSPGAPSGEEAAEAKAGLFIQSFRELGRLLANVDPLTPAPQHHDLLRIERFGLTQADLKRTFAAGRLLEMGPATLEEIIQRLREIYAGSIGVEFTHIEDGDSRSWLRHRMEKSRNRADIDTETKKRILRKLTESEVFEHFLHTRYVGQKRFSGEGADGVIPLIDCLIEKGGELGVKEIVMGMAHRGRLNVLVNTFGKPPEAIFGEFEGKLNAEQDSGEGDVKYHMGFSANVVTRGGHPVHLSLASNPSHLEAVDPVIEGVARAKQEMYNDANREQVVPILVHGDASFAGQGIVYETLNLSQLEGYKTGGTIHIVINNQVGFTTSPGEARSTTYATDLAMMLEIPIFHVNGDDPEALWYLGQLCMEYRQKFHRDVVIDLVCYRRHGHNEGDEPSFTQPLMYKKIKSRSTPRAIYAQRLVEAGTLTEADAKAMVDELTDGFAQAQERARSESLPTSVSVFEGTWRGLHKPAPEEMFAPVQTQVPAETLREIGAAIFGEPKNFTPHPKLVKLLHGRLESATAGKGMDWGTVENLCYGSLVWEGQTVRLSGQDAERGTFSHRHSVLHDYETGEKFTPLQHLGRGRFFVYNSHLSEAGVLGFEFGYALADPRALTIWEAQFGDFSNGAQIIIDQFITTAESKWKRMNGLVMLLPHGYEGQGPEHSSARLERYLQLCGRYNMQVANFTTPAQLFHALRRQVKRNFRKPLVVMSPKSLLRHPLAVSDITDLAEGRFHELLDDPGIQDKQAVRRVLLCSGKIFYELYQEREKREARDRAVVRIEQLYPWPERQLEELLATYPDNVEISWVQEEPRNMGAWIFMRDRWLDGRLGNRKITYVGRPTSATPAVGSAKAHEKEQKLLIETALSEPVLS